MRLKKSLNRKRTAVLMLLFFLVAGLLPFAIQRHIHARSKPFMATSVQESTQAYTAILLGSQVYSNGRLSSFMRLRADRAIELYTSNKVKRILVSGDHGTDSYDEVNTIKNYLVKKGVPTRDIFMDHAGFDTYDSMIRAKKVFMVTDAIIVSQAFHLPRAIYIAQSLGLKAQGVAAENPSHLSLNRNRWREILAGVKAFLDVNTHSSPRFLGKVIPITGNSSPTYD